MTHKAQSYAGYRQIAAWFGVEPSTVAKWRQRYDDFPEPDAWIDKVTPGWKISRVNEFKAWHANRPGSGAGGGRPRKQA